MQTFLPYNTFVSSARCLDNKRLGKQRIECLQILNSLSGVSKGWRNHPAVKMWDECTGALAEYGLVCCYEWSRRGFKDTTFDRIVVFSENDEVTYPWWYGEPMFHASHRSNLLRKDAVHYGQFGWTESDDLPYYWPTKEHHCA